MQRRAWPECTMQCKKKKTKQKNSRGRVTNIE